MIFNSLNSFNILNRKIERLHFNGEHEEVIKLIESTQDIKAEHVSLLARAYQNLEEPDFIKAYHLLVSCERKLSDRASFNFRMGYNLYYRDIISKAKFYFYRVLEINPKSDFVDDTRTFITDCERRMQLGITDLTLNERAAHFWHDALQDEQFNNLLDSNDEKNAIFVVERIQILLEKNSLNATVEIGMGEQFTKPQIIFSPEGLLLHLIIYKQLFSFIPDDLKKKYDFSIGRSKNKNFVLKMNGFELTGDNVELAYTESESGLDIYLKNQELLRLYLGDKDSILNMAYIFIDSFFGEIFCMKHISSINIADKNELEYKPIHEVVDEILAKFTNESYDEYPYDSITSYSLGHLGEIEKVRDDVISGAACFSAIVSDYLSGETYSFDKSFDSGVVYTSLFFDIGEREPKDALALRHEIDDLLKDKEGTIFKIIGGAFGIYSMYTDIVIFDMKTFKSEILNFYIAEAKKRDIKNAYFSVMRADSDVFTLFDDRRARD